MMFPSPKASPLPKTKGLLLGTKKIGVPGRNLHRVCQRPLPAFEAAQFQSDGGK